MEWTESVDQLLLEGEHVRDRVEFASSTLVVTNHRVLAFTPDRNDADFRAIDRPNVRTVTVETGGSRRAAFRAFAVSVLGAGLVVTAALVDPTGVLDDVNAGTGTGPGDDVVGESIGTLEALLVWFEVALLAGGLVFLAVALYFGARYARSRTSRLVVRVAGEDDLTVPVSDAELEDGAVPALERAIGPDSEQNSIQSPAEDAVPNE